MNIFRKSNDELQLKLDAYEAQITDLENGYTQLKESNGQLVEQVKELVEQLKEREDVIEAKEEVIESLEKTIEEKTEEIQEKDKLVEEVIENTMTVEKQAAIKALEILADSGVEVVETIESPEEIDIVAQMKNLKGKDLVEFYKKNRHELIKNLKL
jgi:chromosome segregation ATPase